MKLSFCSLFSGSKGNCYLVGSESTKILIDAGYSARKIESQLGHVGLSPQDISAILITHEHSDHISGAEVFSKKYNIDVYANESTWNASSIVVIDGNKKYFNSREIIKIGDLKIKAFDKCHDAICAVGFSVNKDDIQISVLTDTGEVNEDMIGEIAGADILLLESNHDIEMLKINHNYTWFMKKRILGPYGHLSNVAAAEAITKIYKADPKKRKVVLAHLSRNNNFPQMAFQTVKNILEENGIYIGKHLSLDTVSQNEIGEIYTM